MNSHDPQRTRRRRRLIATALLLGLAVGAVALWRLGFGSQPQVIGSATKCLQMPHFLGRMDVGPGAYIGTSIEGVTGLAIVDSTGAVHQGSTWDDAGYLGAYTFDEDGNLYTAPAPLVSLIENPPDEQNKIWRVDTDSGIMSEWLELEPARPPSELNPFGVVGLGYDCDTHSLYAASLMGSTPDEEVGRVFRIDVSQGRVADVLEGVDAMGLGVFTTANGKRLFFGHARDSGVRSIGLDESGDFLGQPRLEFHLTDLPGGSNERVQRITFSPEDEMKLKGIDFNFTLRVAFDNASTLYTLRYDPADDTWQLVDIARE